MGAPIALFSRRWNDGSYTTTILIASGFIICVAQPLGNESSRSNQIWKACQTASACERINVSSGWSSRATQRDADADGRCRRDAGQYRCAAARRPSSVHRRQLLPASAASSNGIATITDAEERDRGLGTDRLLDDLGRRTVAIVINLLRAVATRSRGPGRNASRT
jgi:hypothetical protein